MCQRTMHYTFMKPKSSYAFGFGFGTVLPVFQWHWVICSKYYLRYSEKSTWLFVTGLERDWTGLDLRGVGDWALVGLQDQGEGGRQIWVGGIALWGWGASNNLLAIRLKCNATLLECFVTSWKLRWVGLGEGMRSDHMVWRHTCSIIDFKVVYISSSSFQYWTWNSFHLIISL